MPVMQQVIAAIFIKIGQNGPAAEPFPGKFIQLAAFEQRHMRRLMHQNRKAQLAGADQDYRQQEGQHIRPERKNRQRPGDNRPAMPDKKIPPEIRALRQRANFFRSEKSLAGCHSVFPSPFPKIRFPFLQESRGPLDAFGMAKGRGDGGGFGFKLCGQSLALGFRDQGLDAGH